MNRTDLDTYLQRIGHTGPCTTTLETLTAIHHAHACSIPFENLAPWLGVPVHLDPTAVRAKLVHSRRGGFCYEHNALLGAALRALGFSVTDLAARVLWNMPPEMIRPRTHMLLVVDLGAHQYVVDAGFGGMTLTAPLRLDLSTPQATPHGPFRLQPTPIDRVLQAEVAGEWKPVYRFDLQPQQRSDYEMASWYLCNHPDSMFRQLLVAARPGPLGRHVLRDRQLTLHRLDGSNETRTLTTSAELREALQDIFGIDLSAVTGLEERFARLP
ncbi:MAG: arylamine N-acetyltransferase [Telluria sp.]|nr:arylamine N-acetyltransferase [Telluria sp.]